MENHPIPQDVTGFKFKLIGSVTVKQFLYILGGGILAAICFILPITGFIKYPLAFLFGGMGTALAFIPIEGRPMDIMIKNFLKALPAENQFIFKKRGAGVLIEEFFSPAVIVTKPVETKAEKDTELSSKRALLYSTLKISSYKPDQNEQAVLSNINTYFNETARPVSLPIQNFDTSPKEIPNPLQVARPTEKLQPNPYSAKVSTQTADKPATPYVKTAKNPVPLVKTATIEPIVQTASPMQTIPAPSQNPPTNTEKTATVTSVSPDKSLTAGFPQLPDTPNIVMGIIKDPRGKIIPNILVEIMDMQGNPVRAFKTNILGQFAAATPLANGEYNVFLDDPRKTNEFETIHIILDGKIFQPLEIISTDQREKLRRELFDTSATQAKVSAIQ